ncbi:hypothetical protein [Criblamydia sequanensis]|uniref:Membrane protein n=1 Tax=Candidatus Criblamydia sequanensis CRIB-18 TaxID=1437425 RepID=A0A090D105_9BACT|nr:hypothetical protein [Criblamydia sequanensis]CDR33258.1 putative membrane protein [Criblamydia sequanensis CRIB-18]
MFLDFSVPWQKTPYIDRVEIGFFQISKIPERIVTIIVNLAKAFFNGLIALLACGQSRMFNIQFVDSALSSIYEAGSILLTPLNLFIPLKTLNLQCTWQNNVHQLRKNASAMMARNLLDANKMEIAIEL